MSENRKPPYPGLVYFSQDGMEGWEGLLQFSARYDNVRIRDSFTIRIELSHDPQSFPAVKEVGGRTQSILKKWQGRRKITRMVDLHVNPNGQICFCPAPEERRRCAEPMELEKFITDWVIPYFFSLHVFEKEGKWPWGQYSHGELGILEYYLERRGGNDPSLLLECIGRLSRYNPIKTQWNGREKCECGSGLKFKKCHSNAYKGYKAVVEDLKVGKDSDPLD